MEINFLPEIAAAGYRKVTHEGDLYPGRLILETDLSMTHAPGRKIASETIRCLNFIIHVEFGVYHVHTMVFTTWQKMTASVRWPTHHHQSEIRWVNWARAIHNDGRLVIDNWYCVQ